MKYLLKVDGWKNNITFSAAHIIFDHDKCGFLHGHTYAIHTNIQGEKNSQGFVIDFSIIKKLLRDIAKNLDHRILVPEKNNYVSINSNEIEIRYDKKKYILPIADCILLPIVSTTAENLAEYILLKLLNEIGNKYRIDRLEIGLDEGVGQGIVVKKNLGK
jgi:6-pyruvoyltetrahydropterin/6-carboxytetrahydropterin synthase